MPSFEQFPGGEHQEAEVVPEELKTVAEEISKSDQGAVNKLRKLINSRVEESKLPTKEGLGFESTLGIYGGKLTKDDEGRMVYDTRGWYSKVDQMGDRLLRSFDENQVKKPVQMLLRHPKALMKMLPFIADSKRYRGTPEETIANAERLGLGEYYGSHPWGVEIKKPETCTHGIALQDILRQDKIKDSETIADIDRFEALGEAARYVHRLHDSAGGIGEANTAAFIFTKKAGDKVEDPIIAISSLTEVYNPEKHVPEIEQKTTDLLDLLTSAATEEYRRSAHDEDPWQNVHRALRAVVDNYGDEKVLKMVASYIKRGRLTLAGDVEATVPEISATYRAVRPAFGAHNTQRLSVKNPEVTAKLKEAIIEACGEKEEKEKANI